jgi:hypothetical protein
VEPGAAYALVDERTMGRHSTEATWARLAEIGWDVRVAETHKERSDECGGAGVS